MAFIMGFNWISGLVLSAFPPNEIAAQILTYLFILANASIGIFIFFAFIFRPEVKYLYMNLLFKKMCLLNGARARLPSHSIGQMDNIARKRFAYMHRTSTIPSLSLSVDHLKNDKSVKKVSNVYSSNASNSTLNSSLTLTNESINLSKGKPVLSNLKKLSSFTSTDSDNVFS